MFQRIRKHLTPSTAIAFMALVFALTGGAFAASSHGGGSSGGSHATLTGSASKAKPKAKAGPRGPAGPKGAPGTPGAPGAPGAKGETGAAGATGATGVGTQGGAGNEGKEGKEGPAGTSVTNTTLAKGKGGCEEGGAEFKVGSGAATHACSGKTGYTETLPAGKTETGAWATNGPEKAEMRVPISFTIPVEGEEAITKVHYLEPDAKLPGECEGTVQKPEAAPGVLCVYSGEINFGVQEVTVGTVSNGFEKPVGGPGVVLDVVLKSGIGTGQSSGAAGGSWAVTAPE
jgi:hypothetical protein